MVKLLCVVAVVACGSAPPPKVQSPEDYQHLVDDLIQQVLDIFKTDGTNCDMLHHDLRSLRESAKFKTAHDWGTSHPDAPQQAQAKINEKKPEFQEVAAPAMHACGDLSGILQQLTH